MGNLPVRRLLTIKKQIVMISHRKSRGGVATPDGSFGSLLTSPKTQDSFTLHRSALPLSSSTQGTKGLHRLQPSPLRQLHPNAEKKNFHLESIFKIKEIHSQDPFSGHQLEVYRPKP